MIDNTPIAPEVKLWLIDYEIDGVSYGAHIPARDEDHAKRIAMFLGGDVLGTDLEAINNQIEPAPLLNFIERLAAIDINWPANAPEQLAAYLDTPRKLAPLTFD